MTLEGLQDQLHGDATLRHGYAIHWNGTRDSVSGTPYLASSEVPAVPNDAPPPFEPRPKFKSALRCAVVGSLTARGPMTIRALADHLRGSHQRVKQCVYNMVKGGYLEEHGRAPESAQKFGRGRPPKLYRVAA